MKFKFEWQSSLTTKRDHGKLMLLVNDEIARTHKYVTLPGHFEEGANKKYHYQKRRDRYLAWKKREYGNQPDLVLSGLLRGYVLVKSKYTRTQKGWRIYVRAPRPLRDEMRAEIEKILQYERQGYRNTMKKTYLALAGTPRFMRKRAERIKG